jgi:hypothetical protein
MTPHEMGILSVGSSGRAARTIGEVELFLIGELSAPFCDVSHKNPGSTAAAVTYSNTDRLPPPSTMTQPPGPGPPVSLSEKGAGSPTPCGYYCILYFYCHGTSLHTQVHRSVMHLRRRRHCGSKRGGRSTGSLDRREENLPMQLELVCSATPPTREKIPCGAAEGKNGRVQNGGDGSVTNRGPFRCDVM